MRLEYADEYTQRYLTWVAGRRRERCWQFDNRTWERDRDGNWFTWAPATDPRKMVRNGISPIVISEDTVDRFGSVREARDRAAGEIKDALRGQREVLGHNPDGSERVDYVVNVKNADGSVSRAARNLADVHERVSRIEESAAEAVRSEVTP